MVALSILASLPPAAALCLGQRASLAQNRHEKASGVVEVWQEALTAA